MSDTNNLMLFFFFLVTSGKRGTSLPLTPLRTVREPFNSYGSSLPLQVHLLSYPHHTPYR